MQYHVLNCSYYTDLQNLNTFSYNCWPFICSNLLPIFELCVSAFVVVIELCLIYFLYSSFSDKGFATISSHSLGCLSLLIFFFSCDGQKLYNLMQFFVYLTFVLLFWCMFKTLSKQMSRTCLCFLLGVLQFQVFHLSYWSILS